jgi:hypothetical protein
MAKARQESESRAVKLVIPTRRKRMPQRERNPAMVSTASTPLAAPSQMPATSRMGSAAMGLGKA